MVNKMEWRVEITKTNNGYYIQTAGDTEGGDYVVEEQEDTVKGEQMAFRDMCNILREIFAVNNDKHNNQYLDITVSGDTE